MYICLNSRCTVYKEGGSEAREGPPISYDAPSILWQRELDTIHIYLVGGELSTGPYRKTITVCEEHMACQPS